MTQQSFLSSFNSSNYQSRALLRNAILLQLEASSPISLPLSTLRNGVQLAGFCNLSTTALVKEMAYLLDKELIVIESPNPVSPNLDRYRINAKGQDYLESQNLI